MNVDKKTAISIIAAIVQAAQAAQATGKSPLKKVLLFGSTVRGVREADLDLILEVDPETFEKYHGFCTVVLDGVRPLSDDPLEHFYGHSWDYFSPKIARSKAALEAIGVSVDRLNLGELEEYMDIICLPEGWDDKTTAVHKTLKMSIADSRDPKFLENAAASKEQFFPEDATATVAPKPADVSKQIFVAARHGDYDHDENLSEGGRQQMQRLATAVREVVSGSDLKISLLCSTAPRAEQGGKILIEALGIPEDRTVFHECFWVDSGHAGNMETARQLIETTLSDDTVVVLLAHLDVVPYVAKFVSGKLGAKGQIYDTSYGQGFMVTEGGISLFPSA